VLCTEIEQARHSAALKFQVARAVFAGKIVTAMAISESGGSNIPGNSFFGTKGSPCTTADSLIAQA
jgi:hypothetical protein